MKFTCTLLAGLMVALLSFTTSHAHDFAAPPLGVLELPFGGETPDQISVRYRGLNQDGAKEVQYFLPFNFDMKELKDRVDEEKKNGYEFFSAITMAGSDESGKTYDYSSNDPNAWRNGVEHAQWAVGGCEYAGIHRLGFAGAFAWSVRMDDATTGPQFQAHRKARWVQFKKAFQDEILPHVAKKKVLRSVHPELLNGFENMAGQLRELVAQFLDVETPEFIASNGGRRLLGPLFDTAHWHKDDACREVLYALFAILDYYEIPVAFHLSPPNRTQLLVSVPETNRRVWTIDVDGVGSAMIANGFHKHSMVIEVFQLNPPFLNGGGLVAGSPDPNVIQAEIAEAIKAWPARWAAIPDSEIAKAVAIRKEVFASLNKKTGWNKQA